MAGMTVVDTPGTVPPAPGPPTPRDRRRTELAEYLRACRARVSPDDVGLPPGLRRRTPGLRREEVAQLAGCRGDLVHVVQSMYPLGYAPRSRDDPCTPRSP